MDNLYLTPAPSCSGPFKYDRDTCPKSETWFADGGRCGWAHECDKCTEGSGLESQISEGEIMKLYGVYGPSGTLREVCETSWEAKVSIFDFQSQGFRVNYWHKPEPAYRAALKLGWKIEIGEYKGSGLFLDRKGGDPVPAKKKVAKKAAKKKVVKKAATVGKMA